MRQILWIPTACVCRLLDAVDGDARFEVNVRECCAVANGVIQDAIDAARLKAKIARIHADVRRAWPIVPRGGKC